jgi:antitoxin PrlF
VVIVRREEAESEPDPVIGRFLGFLAEDMAARPSLIQPVARATLDRARALVKGVRVDLDSALPDDDE